MSPKVRLCKDDFKALRSLARGRWVQGRKVYWKTNRTWSYVPFSGPALDAAFRLVDMGLAVNFVCCISCGEVVQLSQAGQARAEQIDRSADTPVQANAHRIEAQRTKACGWFNRLRLLITARSRT